MCALFDYVCFFFFFFFDRRFFQPFPLPPFTGRTPSAPSTSWTATATTTSSCASSGPRRARRAGRARGRRGGERRESVCVCVCFFCLLPFCFPANQRLPLPLSPSSHDDARAVERAPRVVRRLAARRAPSVAVDAVAKRPLRRQQERHRLKDGARRVARGAPGREAGARFEIGDRAADDRFLGFEGERRQHGRDASASGTRAQGGGSVGGGGDGEVGGAWREGKTGSKKRVSPPPLLLLSLPVASLTVQHQLP